jgi:hypothetical protein
MRNSSYVVIALLLGGCIANPPGSNPEDAGATQDAASPSDAHTDGGADASSDASGSVDASDGGGHMTCPSNLPAVLIGGMADEVHVNAELPENDNLQRTRCDDGVAMGLRLNASADENLQVVHHVALPCGGIELTCADGVFGVTRENTGELAQAIGGEPEGADPTMFSEACPGDGFLVGIEFQGTVTLDGGQENELVRRMSTVCDDLVVREGEVAHAGAPQTGSKLNADACALLADDMVYSCTAPITRHCPDGMVVYGIEVYAQDAIEQPKLICVPVTLVGG